MSIGSCQSLGVDRSRVDGPGASGRSEREGIACGCRVLISLIVQEDEGETRCWDGDGTRVGYRIARNVHDGFFALEASVGLEVRAKGLTCPGKVGLGSDMFRTEVLDSDGGWCAGRLSGLSTADGDSNTQVVGTRSIVKVVEESDAHGSTVLVYRVARC